MPTVSDILSFLDTLAPPAMKMDWDNVGLLCGSKRKAVKKILLALDPFEGVAEEAAAAGADLIITHHPLIFVPVPNVTDETSVGRTLQILAKNDISAVNAHTNLDVAPGGVNDVLADRLGLGEVSVVFARECPDLLRGGTAEPQELSAFLEKVKASLGTPVLRYADGGKPVHRVCVGGGACADMLVDVRDAGFDTFVTSDCRYNQFWDARDMGLNLIDAGHFYTENPVMYVLAEKLRRAFPELSVGISQTHGDVMKFF